MKQLHDKVAVITGAASGLGKAFAEHAAGQGMKLVLADIQEQALHTTVAQLRAGGAEVIGLRTDVSKAEQVQALADAALAEFGGVHLLFNNAGVGAGGLVWENSAQDWEWVLGVNLHSVIHGVRIFTPLMLDAAARDPGYQGHIVNTASMAGLVNAPAMGVYNVTKHAVVALSETLYQDLSLVSEQVHCSVLCPFFVPTGFSDSDRNRPADLANQAAPSRSQRVAQANSHKATSAGKVSAEQIASLTFEAIAAQDFYIYSHPQALGLVRERFDALLDGHRPGDPFAGRSEVRARLIDDLRS
ncbi:SDR family oxidoreductase [Pseudomonas sp. GD03860]|uniref:SDR family oxidoreductase n=1 Tax=Pseudomonas TaxID=286 RepID=UPI0023635EF4|nr:MULTISPECIES: SDR family oxidoreductase [Pseudomonas]MDD2058545.1 SDR family oxidoreductase [Pseudomonas putida]MDH0640727.1 SDR family oxidoreductase [Pseudomonas sp. GD03860]